MAENRFRNPLPIAETSKRGAMVHCYSFQKPGIAMDFPLVDHCYSAWDLSTGCASENSRRT